MTHVRANPAGYLDNVSGRGITARHLNHWRNTLAKSADMDGGGTWMPIGPINILDTNGGALGNVDVHDQLSGGYGTYRVTLLAGTLAATTQQTLGVTSGGQILRFADNLAGTEHELTNTGAEAGDEITFIVSAGGIGNVDLHQDGASPAWIAGTIIVTLAGSKHACAKLQHDGTHWRLADYSPNCTPGAAA
jgi:hypothetical protein